MIEIPNPAGSATEKWQPTRWGVDSRTERLRQLLLSEGVEEGLALGFSLAMRELMQIRTYERRELLEEFSRWANTHTHDLVPVEPLPTHAFIVGGGTSTSTDVGNLHSWSVDTNSWTSLTSMDPIFRHKFFLQNGYGWVPEFYGGSQNTWRYDFNSGTWDLFAGCPVTRLGSPISMAQVPDKLVLLGGRTTASGVIPTVNIYTISTDSWSTGTDIPFANHPSMFALGIGTLIYCFGISNDEVWTYDTDSGVWTNLGSLLPTPVYDLGGCLKQDGKVLLAGGRDPSDASVSGFRNYFWEFDPSNNSVTVLPTLPNNPAVPIVLELKDGIHTIGGLDTGSASLEHNLYDTSTESWVTPLPDWPSPSGGFGGGLAHTVT